MLACMDGVSPAVMLDLVADIGVEPGQRQWRKRKDAVALLPAEVSGSTSPAEEARRLALERPHQGTDRRRRVEDHEAVHVVLGAPQRKEHTPPVGAHTSGAEVEQAPEVRRQERSSAGRAPDQVDEDLTVVRSHGPVIARSWTAVAP